MGRDILDRSIHVLAVQVNIGKDASDSVCKKNSLALDNF